MLYAHYLPNIFISSLLAIYGPMIYTGPYLMLLMRANPLRGQVERGLGPGNQDLFGPVKWHRALR